VSTIHCNHLPNSDVQTLPQTQMFSSHNTLAWKIKECHHTELSCAHINKSSHDFHVIQLILKITTKDGLLLPSTYYYKWPLSHVRYSHSCRHHLHGLKTFFPRLHYGQFTLYGTIWHDMTKYSCVALTCLNSHYLVSDKDRRFQSIIVYSLYMA
jgi:hypothetical protein